RIPDEDEVHPRFGDEARGRIVVGGKHREAGTLLALQLENRRLFQGVPLQISANSGSSTAWSTEKSKRFRSSRCDGTTSVIARRIDSMRPGSVFAHSFSMRPICLRWRFSCEPHRVQGMMGKARASAYSARSSSAT